MLYEYVDEIHEEISLCPIPVHAREKHAYLLRNEEVVCVATADKLFAEVLSRRSCNCGLVTNGVDVGHFSVSRGEEGPPARLRGIAGEGRPVIGYFGALARWLDYRLIAELARSRPGYEIVLIGPDYDGSADALRGEGLPNVHLPGVVDYRSLPQHACWFDVATVPFLVNEITESTSPIKLFEYMALGLPIVTTDLPECRKYASVAIGRDAAEFTAQIDRALASRDDQSRRALLRREAEENSWEAKAGAVAALLAQAVSSPPGMR
jgi:glycosyltransferase involved in cell wall biosynthesis